MGYIVQVPPTSIWICPKMATSTRKMLMTNGILEYSTIRRTQIDPAQWTLEVVEYLMTIFRKKWESDSQGLY